MELLKENKMTKSICVIGGSGLVGSELIVQLLKNSEISLVRSFVRKPTGVEHDKLEEIIIDFDKPEIWEKLVMGDVFFSSLGTTIKTAKSKENQYKVDFTYQYNFAKIASKNNIPAYVLVSSMGANSKSAVFYSRIKGELDDKIQKLNFRKTLIFRPSILDGNRVEKRVGEQLGLKVASLITRYVFKKYKPTPVEILTDKMIKLAFDDKIGINIIEGLQIFEV